IPGSGVTADDFWKGAAAIFTDLAPRNRELLEIREDLQTRIDEWHRNNPGIVDPAAYKKFLSEIGYLLDEPEATEIRTTNVDAEISEIAGPQLAVPILNARYARHAATAP